MKTIKLLIAIVATGLIALFFTTCRGTDCPAFPDYLADYYPYKAGDTLKFANRQNDTLRFPIREFTKTEATSYGFCSNCECDLGFLQWFSEMEVKDSIDIFADIGRYDRGVRITCEFRYNERFKYGKDYFYRTETSINLDSVSASLGDTIVFTKDEAIRINQVTIVKGKGIVEFLDEENNFLWKKVN